MRKDYLREGIHPDVADRSPSDVAEGKGGKGEGWGVIGTVSET